MKELSGQILCSTFYLLPLGMTGALLFQVMVTSFMSDQCFRIVVEVSKSTPITLLTSRLLDSIIFPAKKIKKSGLRLFVLPET